MLSNLASAYFGEGVKGIKVYLLGVGFAFCSPLLAAFEAAGSEVQENNTIAEKKRKRKVRIL